MSWHINSEPPPTDSASVRPAPDSGCPSCRINHYWIVRAETWGGDVEQKCYCISCGTEWRRSLRKWFDGNWKEGR